MEIEAKFALTRPVDAEQIEAMDWTPFRLGARHTVDQHDTFFDTPDRSLSRAYHAVRVRRGGQRTVVTLKGPNTVQQGVHSREEIEEPTTGTTPDQWPSAIRARLHALIGPMFAQTIAPLLHVHNQRRTWPLLHENQVVGEVALDFGIINTGERSIPMHELEVELKGGARALLETVRDLVQRQLPAQPEDRSKFERGYALLMQPDT